MFMSWTLLPTFIINHEDYSPLDGAPQLLNNGVFGQFLTTIRSLLELSKLIISSISVTSVYLKYNVIHKTWK